jgi:hypothetical protein
MAPSPRWWEVRPAQNRKPSTYRCPICGEYLPSLSAHMLMFPEGDHSRRRHAHTACVMRERKAGRLPTREEYERAQGERLGRRESASRMRWAFRPRLRRSRPSDS